MRDINKVLKISQSEFETWDRNLEEHFLLQYHPDKIEAHADRERIFFQTNELLKSIAEKFFAFGRFKDTWDMSKCSLVLTGQYIILRSEKMDIAFNWGLEYNEYFLEAYVNHAENLRFMNDDFWETLLELKKLGKFELSGGGWLNSEQKPYFENKTSTIFQIIRTFMMNQNERMIGGRTQWEFGSLVLKWETNVDWTILLEHSCKAFQLMYKLNYQLWKVSDLAIKSSKGIGRH